MPFLHKYKVATMFYEPAYFVLNGICHTEGKREFGILKVPKLLPTKAPCHIENATGVELKTPETIAE